MKKYISLLMAACMIVLSFGCSNAQQEINLSQNEEITALIPMVMVNGTLYLDTGFNSSRTERCGTMDGEITTSVNCSETPAVNDQSNFGTGYGYQYGETGTIEVFIDDNWRIFATEIVRNTMHSAANFKQPPALTVICGDNTATALTGTSSWSYLHEDGTARHLEVDSLHPLQAKEHMPVLNLLPTAKSSVEPGKAYLLWGIAPDSVTVRCWSEECWGQADAKSEPVTLAGGTEFVIQLKDGNYIYEVIAEWAFPEGYGGRACFSFRTSIPHMEPIMIN